jgi:hypothetical protein
VAVRGGGSDFLQKEKSEGANKKKVEANKKEKTAPAREQ